MKPDVEADLHTFVEARYLHLRRTAYLLCGDWHRAEDLVQTALARMVVAARRRRIDSLDAYSRRVLLRVYLDDSQRGSRRRERLSDELADRPVPPGDRAEALTVLAALRTLPPRQRATIVLRYWEDRSVEETAETLGVTEGTVKSQCAKGLAALRDVLADAPQELMLNLGGIE
ncbi:SigE family RNA polymerase sigma factor [Catellatospora citrea]|uniref:RNA polymerase sigma24 factor n=1 Tax=Catellatospora citrea TaxID=53366 RepID=A0A8J3KS19_9ACTN|nr:SigE family RNA polymerase sigma factor [Catellatospora citrea]RKE10821.1 RNA polymerase sigma-70 factor (sigma-E family) [Catellatospora citrea]GIG00940.1 RNA polymerase sigma24 factor [Catellatospora citrea]